MIDPAICSSSIFSYGCREDKLGFRRNIVMVCSLREFIPVTMMQWFLSPIKSWLKMEMVSARVAAVDSSHMRL
jgi:hypothetical protein